jgi:two-component system, NarL family, nitrate/nitrite response regulator NarL
MTRILIVDDQIAFRRRLGQLLVYAGLEVVGEAGSIDEAQPIAAQQQPDLAVVDVMLPGMNGIDGVPMLKAAAPKMRVILLSAYDDRTHLFRQAALEAGAEAFLSKDELNFDRVAGWKKSFGGK